MNGNDKLGEAIMGSIGFVVAVLILLEWMSLQ